MNILVLNCGSSSLKYQLINMDDESVIAKGLVERIGIDGSILTHKPTGKDKYVVETPMKDHNIAVKLVLDALQDAEHGVIKSTDEIAAVGHRVLHAGEKYIESCLVTEDVKKVVVAYEPIWAIGTGKSANTEIAEKCCAIVRDEIRKMYGDAADAVRVQYGGSVKPNNIKEYMAMEDIDGALIGGASLKVDSFKEIIDATK